jgi:hypothetical protein
MTGESIRGKEVDLFIERQRRSRKINMAETNAWREEQPRERQEEEESPTACALFKGKSPEERRGSCVYSASGTWIRSDAGPWARWIAAAS